MNRRSGVVSDDMDLRALALALAIPVGLVTFMDRYPSLVSDAARVVRATLAMF